ncbi:hypothetical protein [Mycolicibacterium mengxianglii]|uniref:hypothetical protein n=1 Tax=Mycolicibacterium mengxianglii TaxID=2736649 RepID=UPI001E3E2EC3|nr:hypothetical protein [Mycolicibacterium mengxianglii]
MAITTSAMVAALVLIVGLGGWHLRTRRHPAWKLSSDARFYITLGYPMIAIAVYWFVESPSNTGLEWLFGNAWALAAMVSFVLGFTALDDVPRQHQRASKSIETIPETGRTHVPTPRP